jgi:DNA helicase HerA-like ATPase
VLNATRSTPAWELFDAPTVVNLSQLADDRDKSLVMALLLMGLFEYRLARHRSDDDYRRQADSGRLLHLTMVEEAHRLLRAPGRELGADAAATAAGMFSDMLSEFRAYGQGVAIVDQFPARLIADAVKNTNYKIVHRLVARDDRDAMACSMALQPDQQHLIPMLRVGQAIVCSSEDDAAAWVKVAAPCNRVT